MNTRASARRLALVTVIAAGAALATLPSAQADPAPQAQDVVGVGSDIVQNSLDFLADGDMHGNPGYNTTGNKNRLYSFDATADANGRNAFVDPSLTPGATTGTPLNPTVVLRAGTYPVQRPNGGGAGITALTNDGSGGHSANLINFVRSPNLPTAAQQAAAQSNLGTSLYTVQIAVDKQVMATAATTNAPSALSVDTLVKIYKGTDTTWSQVPGYTGSAGSQTIVPLIPQNGAGVQKVFLNALYAANGGTFQLGANVRQVQQNDPTTITGLSDAERPNAIVPFPVGRYKLLNDGYFHDPNQAYSSSNGPVALSASGIALQKTGTAGDNKPAFSASLPYYVIFRQSDASSTTPWQPGSTLNWVQELFSNPGGPAPFVNTAPGQAILTAAGVTPQYDDLGVVSSG